MIIDELNKKIADIESLANDKTSTIESKVSDLTDGLLMVADAVDIIPEMVDEKITAITKEFSAIKDSVSKVKAQKGDNGRDGIDGLDGLNGRDGKDGSPDKPKDIADKLNTLENVIDPKVIKGSGEYVNKTDLNRTISTLENQTRYLIQSNASKGSGTGTTTTINGLSGDVTFSEGNNITLNTSGNDIEINADFTQTGKYMISGGITWSGTGLTYDVSFLNYFFNGNKTANPIQVTLAASDPTNNRFDAIVVDEAGTVTTITGTASANPEVPAIPEDQLQVTIILVAAGSTTPTIASEEIYMDDPTTGWTFSTYTTGTPTGSINFAGTSSPKQGTECIEASTDARLGARFVRGTSFDAFQYTMLQVWVRFTGTAVASNKSLNVRFENSAGTLVANTVNLFSYGLQRGVLNTWQLVVVPITAFGALPATVKGLKMIMAGGTVGVVRQWDIDYMILTNGSVPYANVPTIAFYKDDIGIASQSGINLIEGTGVTIDAVNNPLYNRVDYTINSSGGGGSPAGSNNQIQINQSGAFFADSTFQKSDTDFNVGLDYTTQSAVTFTGSGLDDLTLGGIFSGTASTTYTVTVAGTGTPDTFDWTDGTNSGTGVSMDTSPITLSNGVEISFGTDTGHTLTESWTWTYSYVNQNVLDFSNNDYKFQSTFGTGTFGYQISDNLLGLGYEGSAMTLSDGSGNSGFRGLYIETSKGDIFVEDNITLSDGTTVTAGINMSAPAHSIYSYNGSSFKYGASLVSPEESNLYIGNDEGNKTGFFVQDNTTFFGNKDGGNNTRITIDDVNEQITISNLSAYDDDTAAGVGGLTAGMVYMTTGSGSAPLNAAGILMIKQ